MVRINPPIRVDIQVFHARPQPHIRHAPQRQTHVVAQRMRGNALTGQLVKARVDLGRNLHAVTVVVGNDRGRFNILRGRVEGAAGQVTYVQLVPRRIPIDVISGNPVEAPCLHPTLKSQVRSFVWIVGQPRRQRLKDVKDAPVPCRPHGKGSQRQQNANHRHAHQLSRRNCPTRQSNDKRRRKGYGGKCAIGPQECGPGDRECKPQRIGPARTFPEARHRPHRQRQHKERGRLGERSRRVGSGEGAKRRQPKRRQRCSAARLGGCDAAHEIRQQQAAQQFQGNLRAGRGKVILHPEKPETSGEKKRIAGQPDQRGVYFAVGRREGKTPMQQQIFGQITVDERVAVDVKEALQHPQPKDEARGQRQRCRQCVAGLAHLFGHPPPRRQLTLFGSFHTIRTV